MKVSSTFSKAAESRGKASGRAPQSAEPSCAYKSAGGGPRGNPRRGFPRLFVLWVCACAPFYWAVVVGLSCRSTPFLWCLPKETVSSRQRKALFYPGGSTIRVSASASVIFTHLRPTLGRGGCVCAVSLGGCRCSLLPFDPISLVLAQRNSVEPPKKSALKPPHYLGGPARLAHSALSPNGTNWCVKLICTRWVDRALKSA